MTASSLAPAVPLLLLVSMARADPDAVRTPLLPGTPGAPRLVSVRVRGWVTATEGPSWPSGVEWLGTEGKCVLPGRVLSPAAPLDSTAARRLSGGCGARPSVPRPSRGLPGSRGQSRGVCPCSLRVEASRCPSRFPRGKRGNSHNRNLRANAPGAGAAAVRRVMYPPGAFEAGGWDSLKSGRCGEARPAPNGEEGAGGPGRLVGSLGSRLLGGQVREGALGGTGLPLPLCPVPKRRLAPAAAGRSRWTGRGCELARSLLSGGPLAGRRVTRPAAHRCAPGVGSRGAGRGGPGPQERRDPRRGVDARLPGLQGGVGGSGGHVRGGTRVRPGCVRHEVMLCWDSGGLS